jgi:hypothetical protein
MRFKVDENLPREVCDLLNSTSMGCLSSSAAPSCGPTRAQPCSDQIGTLFTRNRGFSFFSPVTN